MTTHELAQQLLALPDGEIHVSGWIDREGYELAISQYEDGYILYQQPNEHAKLEAAKLYKTYRPSSNGIEIPVSDELREEYRRMIDESRFELRVIDATKDARCARCALASV